MAEKAGSPFIAQVTRDGMILYDTRPSQEYLKMKLGLAEEALTDTRLLLDSGRLRAAANRTYYDIFHATTAALDSKGVERARTHMGVIHLFREHFVRTGRMDERFSRNLQMAYNLRHNSDYEGNVEIEEVQIGDIVEEAATFIEEVRQLIVSKES